MTVLNPKMIHVSRHRRDRMVGATLADNLREQYERRSVRVIKGDSVRVMRGEYKDVEGKVEEVDTRSGTLHIEGIQHDKVRGGQVKVPIHSSKVMVTGLKLDDKYRAAMLAGKEKPAEKKQDKPKAEKKETKKKKAKKEEAS